MEKLSVDQPQIEQNKTTEVEESMDSERYMLYDDSSSSCESYYSQTMYQSNNIPVVPKLNLGGFKLASQNPVPSLQLNQKPQPTPITKQEKVVDSPLPEPKPLSLGMNLESLKQKDFQDEFMEKYDEFSESWRQQIEQGKRF